MPAATAENPYVSKAGLFWNDMRMQGQTVVLDATGTSLLVQNDSGAAWHSSVPFRIRTGDHIFDLDYANDTTKAMNHFGLQMTDGKITVRRDTTNGSTITLDGTINMGVALDGTVSGHRAVFFHDTGSLSYNSKIILNSGSVTFPSASLRGKTSGHEFLVRAGDHHIANGFVINEDKSQDWGDALCHVAGGKLTVDGSAFWLGKTKWDKGILRIDGTGAFEVGSGAITTYFPDGAEYKGLLSVGGEGSFVSQKGMQIGHSGGTAEILVEDNGSFLCAGYAEIGQNDNCDVTVTVKDQATFRAPNAMIANGAGRKAHFTFAGDSTTEIFVGDMAANATASMDFAIQDNAVVKIGNNDGNINFGNNSGSRITFEMTGGSLERYSGGSANNLMFKGGPGSTYTFAGGTAVTANIAIEGVQNDNLADRATYTNTVTVAGGTLTANSYVDIRGNNRNAMLVVESGTLNHALSGSGLFRIGHGGDGNGYHSILRQTGGVMNLGATVNLCDSNASGEIELFGGVCRVWTIRGWNYSEVRSSNANRATLYGNGGTIVPWNDNLTFLYTMSAVYVGEDGLAIDTKGYNNVMMKVKVENKDGADGLFVKKGAGTLKVGLVETDGGAVGEFAGRSLAGEQTYTRIDEGKLIFADTNEVVFGENVIVKGGATLSLEGTPATMTVDTLTLGDGRGFAVLKLDAGDTVVVNSANGITALCGVLEVPWKSTEGTYAVFTCKAGVSTSELDKIGVLDADVTKDYAWTTEVDAGTGYTICSVVVAPAGTLTKTITYAEGSVTTNGTGLVSGIVATADGAQSGPLALAHTATVSVDDGKTLSLGGPLVGSGTELVKAGSGLLTVSGSNPDFYGSFMSRGGIFAVDNVGAFGPAGDICFPLILGGGTFRYTGQDEAVFDGGLTISASAKKQLAILDNVGDMTFKSVQHVQGGFIKTGVGTLTFDLPEGTYTMGSNAADEQLFNTGSVNLPANGNSPTNLTGLAGVTILEGTMKVVGAGRDKTTLQTLNHPILGSDYRAQKAPVLWVEDARFNFGSGSRSGALGLDLRAGDPTPAIALTNAMFWADNATFGRYSFSGNERVVITMKDSEFYGHYNAQIGSGTVSVTIDADNSQMHSNGMVGWNIQAKTLDADFHGAEAELGSFDTSTVNNNSAGRFIVYNQVTGQLKFRDGATWKTTRGVNMNNSTLDVVFDGGRYEIAAHTVETNLTSSWNAVADTGFTTTGAGMEIAICEGSTHSFNFPIKGAGGVVKTGLGTFELVAARAEGEKLLQYTGGTVVSNGTFVIDGSLVADGAKSFEVVEGAILDLNETTLEGATIAGAGVVTNGTLSAATIAYDEDALPTFSDVAFSGTLFVDFGKSADDPLDMAAAKAGIVVAHYTGEAPANLRVKSVNTGIERARTAVVCEGGDVIAKMTQSGFFVVIR